jgi:hypothetical protein
MVAAMTAAEFARLMPDVARHFWGEPNHHHSKATELRWGTNGARSVDVGKGTWYDHEAAEGGGVIDFLKREGVHDPWEWLRQNGFAQHHENGAGARPKIAATYGYTDEHENLLFQVVRLDPKTFRQRRPAGPDDPPDKVKNGWVWSVKGVRHVLFRLPELIEALALKRRVFIVEGEKDVLTLQRHGIPATCNPGGAGKWRAEFAVHLVGADVVIVPDNDAPGREHAEAIARSLTGKAAHIRVVDLPGLPDKGDVSDWFAAGGTVETFNELVGATADYHDEAEVNRIRREREQVERRDRKRTNSVGPNPDARPVIRLEAGKYHEIAETNLGLAPLWPDRDPSISLNVQSVDTVSRAASPRRTPMYKNTSNINRSLLPSGQCRSNCSISSIGHDWCPSPAPLVTLMPSAAPRGRSRRPRDRRSVRPEPQPQDARAAVALRARNSRYEAPSAQHPSRLRKSIATRRVFQPARRNFDMRRTVA